MSNEETAEAIRRWVAAPYRLWSWPTDACGYDQHIAFVRHRNEHWTSERASAQTFEAFCLEYADQLAPVPSP